MADWAAAVLSLAPALHPHEVFEMDALYSLILFAAKARLARAGRGQAAGPEWKSDGMFTQRVRDMAHLAAILRMPMGFGTGGPNK